MAWLRGALLCAAVLLYSTASRAQQIDTMKARLSEEADAFRRIAPQVLGEEKLQQKAQKPPPRFHPRVGNAAKVPPPVVWQERQIISEYGFGAFTGPDHSGLNQQPSLHELRQVISVDGRKLLDSAKAQDLLTGAISRGDDSRKKKLLKEFEKYGLIGAVTDFGQVILLFTPRDMAHYEFTSTGPRLLGGTQALVFAYRQVGGPKELTLFQANQNDQATALLVEGEVWVRADNYLPLRITVHASQGQGAGEVKEEAAVDYAMSAFGALLPASTEHRELRAGRLVATNTFLYSGFHKFGASSDIRFEAGK